MLIAGLALLAGAGGSYFVASTSRNAIATTDRAAIETVTREYILSHPEILPEAMQNLRAREMSDVVNSNRKALETPFAGAWAGAADGDVTLVEFFDYACGYCRTAAPDVARLLAEDKRLKVVFRELPILGPDSETAARASLAAAAQGHYYALHQAIYAAGRPNPQSISEAMTKIGVDIAKTNAASNSEAVTDEIKRNLGFQHQLQLTGTPSWIVGDQVINGAVGYEELKKAIAAARAK